MPSGSVLRPCFSCFSKSTLNYLLNEGSRDYIWKACSLDHYLLRLRGNDKNGATQKKLIKKSLQDQMAYLGKWIKKIKYFCETTSSTIRFYVKPF